MPFGELLSTLTGIASLQLPSIIPIPLQNTALVVIEAVGVNILYAIGRRKFTNVEKMRRYSTEMKAFRSELSEATRAGDKQKVEKLKKKQQQMQKMQLEMSRDQMKPTLLFMLPLLGVYYLVSRFIGVSTILAISPIPLQIFGIGPPIAVNFFWWYFICSFTFSGMISRLFGLTLD